MTVAFAYLPRKPYRVLFSILVLKNKNAKPSEQNAEQQKQNTENI